MSCPICGELCRCAEPRTQRSRTITLDEIDPFEDTEEQFASSVAGSGYHHDDDGQELASGMLESARERYGTAQTNLLSSASAMTTNTAEHTPENWKDEVASRLQNYKARRRRNLGQESLRFNFESTAGNHVFLRPEREPDPEPVYEETAPTFSAHNAFATAPALEESYEPPTESMDESTTEAQGSFVEFTEPVFVKPVPMPEPAKLIVFPRPPMMQEPPRDQLADPVFDAPRIVEVPQEVETVAIPLADITLRPEVAEDLCEPHVEPLAELPYRVAPQIQRIAAEIVDTLVVAVATGIFATVLAKMSTEIMLLDTKTTLEMAFLIPVTFWCLYKYLFLVHGGTTPGMKLARLQLINFDGDLPRRKRRRNRALSMIVSIFPLGLGLLWAFVDPDQLCWHDRISRTYLTAG